MKVQNSIYTKKSVKNLGVMSTLFMMIKDKLGITFLI